MHIRWGGGGGELLLVHGDLQDEEHVGQLSEPQLLLQQPYWERTHCVFLNVNTFQQLVGGLHCSIQGKWVDTSSQHLEEGRNMSQWVGKHTSQCLWVGKHTSQCLWGERTHRSIILQGDTSQWHAVGGSLGEKETSQYLDLGGRGSILVTVSWS